MNQFARALYDICLEEESTASVEAIRNSALSKVAGGEVKTLISSSLNSKSFNFNVSLPADKVLEASSWAIREYNRGTVTAIQFDFSRLA
jgi:hypothetical protein